MANIRIPRLLYLKGDLLLAVSLLASGLLIAEHPSWKVALLLALAVWGFARAYYFAFYVIEHYIDGSYKFAGLFDFLKYAMGCQKPSEERDALALLAFRRARSADRLLIGRVGGYSIFSDRHGFWGSDPHEPEKQGPDDVLLPAKGPLGRGSIAIRRRTFGAVKSLEYKESGHRRRTVGAERDQASPQNP